MLGGSKNHKLCQAGDNAPVSYEIAPEVKMSTITLPGIKIINSVFNMELLLSYKAKGK